MSEVIAETPKTMVVSTGCAWFGPTMEARVRVIDKQDRFACPTCSAPCDEIDMATFQRSLDGNPRPEFRQAMGWSIGRHFPSIDEMYRLYADARRGTENPVPESEFSTLISVPVPEPEAPAAPVMPPMEPEVPAEPEPATEPVMEPVEEVADMTAPPTPKSKKR